MGFVFVFQISEYIAKTKSIFVQCISHIKILIVRFFTRQKSTLKRHNFQLYKHSRSMDWINEREIISLPASNESQNNIMRH